MKFIHLSIFCSGRNLWGSIKSFKIKTTLLSLRLDPRNRLGSAVADLNLEQPFINSNKEIVFGNILSRYLCQTYDLSQFPQTMDLGGTILRWHVWTEVKNTGTNGTFISQIVQCCNVLRAPGEEFTTLERHQPSSSSYLLKGVG